MIVSLLVALIAAASLMLGSVVSVDQQPFLLSQPSTQSISLVDLLSASSNHSLLLKAFQRARLVPLLNGLNKNGSTGATLLAPTNEALLRKGKDSQVWTSVLLEQVDAETDQQHDNLQLELREILLYHLINSTIFEPNSTSLVHSDEILYETLYFPSLSPYNDTFPSPPTLPGSPPDKDDPDQPRRPEGLLGSEGQKLRIIDDGNAVRVGVEPASLANGGFKTGLEVIKGSRLDATHGVLVSIDGVLDRPINLAEQIRSQASLSIFASLLPHTIMNYLAETAHLTLFAPTNDAWSILSDLELRYLKSGFAELDLAEIFGDLVSARGSGNNAVGYMDRLTRGNGSIVTTILGRSLAISSSADRSIALVNGTSLVTTDILAKNGVLHLSPSLLLPHGALSLNAEKYLIALNCTRFVSLVRSVNLSHYLQVPSDDHAFSNNLPLYDDTTSASDPRLFAETYTILAPRDELLSSGSWNGRWSTIPPEGSHELRELLLYHFIAGKRTVENLRDGELVATELRGEERDGMRQMLEISVAEEKSIGSVKAPRKIRNLGFGGASVVAEVEVGASIVYLISSVLELPTSPLSTALASSLRLSSFVASLYSASLDRIVSRSPSLTFLIPTNAALDNLGLAMKYLLLSSSRNELRDLLMYHIIDDIVYLDGFPRGSNRFPTLHGSEIYVEKTSHGSIFVHGSTIGGKAANGETKDAKVVEGNLLTSSGVIHVLDAVELPPNVDISIEKLLRGAKALTMLDLIRAANLTWVLDGSKNPMDRAGKSDPIEGDGMMKKSKDRAYIVLAPSDKALSRINITHYLSNLPALEALVKLHIIPIDANSSPPSADGRPLALSDSAVYSTLLEDDGTSFGKVAFRLFGEDSYIVGIKDARGRGGHDDSALVVAYGRATPRFFPGSEGRLGGGVLLIDSTLIPYDPSWFIRYGWIVVVIALGLILILGVGLLGWKVWKGKQEGTYEALEGEED